MSNKQKTRLYIAYGSNLNREQMARRCPTARIIGQTFLHNWRLMFRGGAACSVATIEKKRGYKVPVLVWQLQPKDEQSLDMYEGYPHLYRKETLRITVEGRRIYAMVYIMNEKLHPHGSPSDNYLNTIQTGYQSAGFDGDILERAVIDSLPPQEGGTR